MTAQVDGEPVLVSRVGATKPSPGSRSAHHPRLSLRGGDGVLEPVPSATWASIESAAVSWRAATARRWAARSRTRRASASAARPVHSPRRRCGPEAVRQAAEVDSLLAGSAARLRITSVSPYMKHLPPSRRVRRWGAFPDGRGETPLTVRTTWKTWLRDGRRGRPVAGQEACPAQAVELLDDRRVGGRVDRGGAVHVVPVVVVADDAFGPAGVGEGDRHLLHRGGSGRRR